MPMNIQRKTSNIANIIVYDASGNIVLPAGLTVTGLNTAGYVKTNATGVFSISATVAGSDVTGAALTKTDDTNVTITLGGTPATALLRAASLTLGWTGQLAVSRGGTGLSALGTANQLLRVNAGATALEYFTPTYLTANQSITLSGDVSGSGTTAITTTLATVTQSTGANFVKITLDTKGRVTGNTAVASGDITTALGYTPYNSTNPSGYTSNTGTVTTVSVTTANGISGTVATASTTPAITLTLGAITPTSVNSVVISGSATPTLAVTGTSSISGSNTGDNAVNSLYSGLVSNATHTGDATGATALTVVGLRGVALPALGASAGFLRYTGTGTNTWVFDTSTYITGNQSITLSGDVSGTGTTAITATLATVTQSTGASFVKITLDTKGRVTGNTAVAASDLNTTYGSQTANTFYAAPNGTAGNPSFRAIAAADIPTLNQNTTGSAGSVANSFVVRADSGTTEGTDIYTFNGSAAKNINIVAGTNMSITKTAGQWTINTSATTNTGTVTSVGGTGTVSGLTLTGTVTTTGNLTLGGTLAVTASNFATQTANTVLAGPTTGVAATPTFRALVAADIPALSYQAPLNGTGFVKISGTTISYDNSTYYLASNPSGYTTNTGTVTSVAALTLGTTGTDLSSTVATGTTTAVITLNVPTASAANRGALSAADWSTFNGKQAALNGTGFVKATGTTISYDNTTYQSTLEKGVANGYASLNSSGQVPSTQLPSYVDDVLEFANLAAFPATGEAGKIYVTADTNKTYRWTGTVYVEISASPGSTDVVTEGTTNLYFTNARARAALSFTAGSGAYNSTTGVITIPTNTNQLTNGAGYITGNQSITWTAAGDISGTTSGTTSITPTLTVTGLRGVALPALGASAGFLRYTGTGTNTWVFDTVTYLTANQSITLSGDVGGSGTTAITTTLATITQSTGSSFVKITLDTKGRVTGNTTVAASDLNSTFGSQTANTFYAAPNGAAGNPGFRAIVAADIPTLNQNTTGSAGSVANSFVVRADSGTTEGTDIYSFNGSATKNINIIAGTNISITKAAGSWTIASTGTGLNGTGYVKMSGTTVSYVASIPNTDLANSSISVQGSSVSLGGSVNVINGTGFVKASGTTISYDNSTYALSSHTHSYFIGTTAVQTSSANQALTGITGITFAAEASDAASITTTISSTSTFFDFNLADDNNNDEWRWRFTPSGGTVYNAMRLVPVSNTAANLTVSGTIASSNFSGSSSGTNTGDQTLSGLGGQPQLNGTGFVKASGTTISYDNSTYYLASNPNGYTTNTGTVTSVGGTGTVSGLTLSGTVTTSGSLTLGGTLTLTAANVNAVGAITNNTSGTAGSTAVLTASGALTTQQGSGTVIYSYALTNPQTGLFAASDNANSILTVNRHPGDYYSQLGFSSNGNLYYRNFVNTPINTSQAWQQIWTSSSLTNLNQLTNGPGYTSNTGTVTSVGGTGTVSGLTLSGTVSTSGNLTLGGTLSASIDNITDEHRLFNNMGDVHGTRSSFDTTTPSYNFGWRYIQGTGSGPGVNSATQYYSVYVGLGNDYPATGAGSYGMQIAFPRNVSNPYIAIRYNENNGLAAWQKISAGYADSAGTATTAGALTSMNISQFTNNSGYLTGESDTLATVIGRGNSTLGDRPIVLSNTDGAIFIKGSSGGWAMGTYYLGSAGTNHGGFGVLGSADAFSYFWVGAAYNNTWMTFTSSAVNSQVALQQGGNQVLHAGNYNSYAPTLGGTGATGTWGISITGNAATATNVAYSGLTGTVPTWNQNTTGNAATANSATTAGMLTIDNSVVYGRSGLQFAQSSSTAGNTASSHQTPTNDWWHVIRMNHANNAGYYADLAVSMTTNLGLARRVISAGSQLSSWVTILDGLNYNSYSPTLTGGNASGTWGINVTGSAGSVAWGNVTSKPSLIMYYQGFTLDANTMDSNATGFTYSVNAPYTGPIIKISEAGYALQINAAYQGGNDIAFRTRQGDIGTWNAWNAFLHSANYNSYSPTLTGGGASGTWNIDIAGTVSKSVAAGSEANWLYGIMGDNDYFRIRAGGASNGGWLEIATADDGTEPIYVRQYTGTFGSITRTLTLLDASGNTTLPGVLTVGSGANSYIYMTDTDETTRLIHCNSGRIGFLTSAGNWGSYCDNSGNWISVGDITAFSDARTKENVNTVDNALDKLLQLRGVYYNRIGETTKSLGVIAQEIQAVVPEVVKEQNDGMLSVAYGNLAGVFIEAIKEQQAQIEDLKKQIQYLVENR